MFEKEAEYYAKEKYSPNTDPFIIAVADDAFKDDAFFGYNKAKEEIAELKEQIDALVNVNIKAQNIIGKAKEIIKNLHEVVEALNNANVQLTDASYTLAEAEQFLKGEEK